MSAEPARDPLSWGAILEQQDQVITRRQARLGGMTEEAWHWRMVSGRWRLLLRGVAVAHSGEPTASQLAWAALLACGRGAALTADAALLQHGMRAVTPVRWDVAVPADRHVTPRTLLLTTDSAAAIRPRRVKHLEALAHPVRAPRVVRAAPAVLQAAAWAASDRAAEWRVAAAVQQGIVTAGHLRAALADLPALRRHGLLVAVIDDVEFGAHARSELDFLGFLRRHRLPPPDRLQRPVRIGGVRYLDAWWERPRVGVEIDGAHHREAGTWDADTLRANAVVIAGRRDGDVLVRFTGGNLRHDEPVVAEQLAALLC